MSINVDCSLE